MSFNLRDLSVLAYANGFTLWHYKAAALADVTAPGFFDEAASLTSTGDMLLASAPDGGRVLCLAVEAGSVVAH